MLDDVKSIFALLIVVVGLLLMMIIAKDCAQHVNDNRERTLQACLAAGHSPAVCAISFDDDRQ